MNGELKIINLKCSGCGAPLEISPNMEDFSCGYCGAAQRVVRRGGTVSLSLIGDAIARVQAGTDKTAAELAIRRLRDTLEALTQTHSAQSAALRNKHSAALAFWLIGAVLAAIFSFVFLGHGNPWGLVGLIAILYVGYVIRTKWVNQAEIERDMVREYIACYAKILEEIEIHERLVAADTFLTEVPTKN